MSNVIKILGSSSNALTSGVSTLGERQLAITEIAGVRKFYVGGFDNIAYEIAGASYALLASPAFTGTPTAPTAASGTNTTQIATTQFVTSAVATAIAGGSSYQGSIDCSTNPNYPAALVGQFYVVSVAGKIGGSAGEVVQSGDFIFCNTNNAGGTEASVGADFDIVQGNIDINVLAGVGLAANGAALDVKYDNSTIGINGSNQLYVLNSGISDTQLAGSISDSKLSTITTANKVSGSAIQLASGSAIENNTGLDVNIDGASIVNTAGELSVGTVDAGTF
jgi:hypothetical protein